MQMEYCRARAGWQGQSAPCDGGRQQGPHCANGIFAGGSFVVQINIFYKMKRMLTRAIVLTMLVIASSVVSCPSAFAQKPAGKAQTEAKASADTAAANTAPASQGADAQAADTAADAADDASLAALGSDDSGMPAEESQGFYKSLKTKFIEGNAGFMSFVALALVLGLAFCHRGRQGSVP